ncbi:MAG: ATP-binding protein [Acidimicrobiales bacterium]
MSDHVGPARLNEPAPPWPDPAPQPNVAAVLRAFADLAPSGSPATLDLSGGEPMVWLGLQVPPNPVEAAVANEFGSVRRTPAIDRLMAVDALHAEERLLRLGWVLLRGEVVDGDRRRAVRIPLVQVPVRVTPGLGRRATVHPAGDAELAVPVGDGAAVARLEATAAYGGGALGAMGADDRAAPALLSRLTHLQAWIRAVAEAAGLPLVSISAPGADGDPTGRVEPPAGVDPASGWVTAHVGSVLFVARDPLPVDVAGTLRTLADVPGAERTALAAVYGFGGVHLEPDAHPVRSPMALSAPQRTIVERSRHEPVVVVSGPPGSGKSHVLAAVAIDAVDRGSSVLVATRSPQAADVLGRLLARQPGPAPVLFGDAEHRDAMRRELGDGLAQGALAIDLLRLVAAVDSAATEVADTEAVVAAALGREAAAGRAPSWDPLVPDLAHEAPVAFDARADLAVLAALGARAEAPPESGAFTRWRARRADRRWRRALGAGSDVPAARLHTALRAAVDRRAAAELTTRGGTSLGAVHDRLVAADAALAAAVGALVDARARTEARRKGPGRVAAGGLGAALRSGRRTRRQLLAQLDGPALVGALPLWVGTLRDVDDLLPAVAGLFDLVLLDEASQIDQPVAAGALIRARRAVVVGDPRQLRHVSFLGDADVAATLARHGLTAMADRLDLRRSSLFDLAAGRAPVTWLDEHHRSVPHLIGFSARRFYDDRLRIATRHPATEATDAIDVVVVDAGADVAAAVAEVERLVDAGQRDIGVLSPFRAVADALEAALLARFTPEEVIARGLRVGTAHAFQGGEHDHIVVALGLSPTDTANRRRFVEDPNLFNVMVTRARRDLVVVTAVAPPADPARPAGLLEAYLAYADAPPAPHPGGQPATPWVAALVTELIRNGVAARPAYPVGRWVVDIVAGAGERAAALDCTPHVDGPGAHLDRHRALRRAGWQTLDAWPTRWDGDATRAALDLVPLLR